MDVNNQGLNIPSNLQNLDVRDELLSTEVGSGSACAYSLRDLTGNNLNCVRVRREPEDTTDAIDNEKIFSAQSVASGELEDWVNGKLENTLPVDVDSDNCAGAYSLRKVKSSYAEDAVHIRRTSDDTEVDVAFDLDDKVSTSSSISVVSGSTNATDLNGFLNEEHEITNTGSNLSNKITSSVQGTTTDATYNSIDFTVTQLQTSGGSSTDNMWLSKLEHHNDVGIGKVRISLDCTHFDFENGGTVIVQPFYDSNGNGSNSYSTAISIDGTGSFSGEIDTLSFQTTEGFRIFKGDVALGDRIRIENFKVESLKTSATVHTWYDQAGSNDAVQDSAGNQPVIAENGALLTDGLTFDGSNDFLQTSTQVLTGTETGANSMYAVIKQTSGDAGYICGSASNQINGVDYVGQSLYGNNVDGVFVLSNGNNIDEPERDNITITQGSTVLVSANYSNNNTNTLNKNANSNGYSNGTNAYNFNAGSKFTIGARDGSTVSAVLFNGSMKEIIAYDSDQTDNRFKIESNINNYYGLYTSQGNGFVETWYDQSGNGNHATQGSATSQPKIVDSGSLVTQDGKPALAFDGEASTGDHLTITKPSQLSTDMSILTVINFIDPDGKDNNQDVFISQAGTRWWLYAQNSASGYTIRSNSNTGTNAVVDGGQPINTQRLFTVIRNNSSDSAQLRVNGSLEDDNTSGMTLSITSDDFTLGRLATGNRHSYANAQEVIFFGSAIESDASEMETEINNYYNIYS